jgi:hypothetical protein
MTTDESEGLSIVEMEQQLPQRSADRSKKIEMDRGRGPLQA